MVDDLSSGDRRRVAPAARLIELDIVDHDGVAAVVEEVRPETVFHLAAQSSVVVSVENPGRDCEVNVGGTLNVVDAANKRGVPVVFTSTGGALYGDEAPRPTGEDTIPKPLSPYGASKLAGESYVGTWSRAEGVPNAVCRLGNVYGPRQSPHGEAGVVSIFTHRLHTGRGAEAVRARAPDARLRLRRRCRRRAAGGGGEGGHVQHRHGRGNGCEHDLERAARGRRLGPGARTRGPAPGRAAAQPAGREPRRARARLARAGADRRGPAENLRGA